MKHLLLSLALIISANAWTDDELPKYLYCEFGKASAEFHFNDEGENWFIVKGGDKAFEKKTIIKKLKVSKQIFNDFLTQVNEMNELDIVGFYL